MRLNNVRPFCVTFFDDYNRSTVFDARSQRPKAAHLVLVRSMRAIGLSFLTACLLTGCATHLAGIRVYGPLWLVSSDDIRVAIAADQRARYYHPHAVLTISRSPGTTPSGFYHEPKSTSYCEVRRSGRRPEYIRAWLVVD